LTKSIGTPPDDDDARRWLFLEIHLSDDEKLRIGVDDGSRQI